MITAHELFAPVAANPLATIGFLINIWLKASALLGVAAILAAALRKSPASTRHAVWVIALSGLAALPLLAISLPPLNVPLLPAAMAAAQQRASIEAADRHGETSAVQPGAFGKGTNDVRQYRARNLGDLNFERDSDVAPAAINAPGEGVVARHISFSTVLGILWLAGFLVSLARWIAGVTGAWMMTRQAQPITSDECIADFRHLAQSLKLSRSVRLMEYDGGNMPMTCGIIRPVILLPVAHLEWPAERRRVVLLHELSHVSRWDCLAQAVAQIVCALYWINPLVWAAAGRLRLESENACDDVVIENGTKASAYAGHLLEIARAFGVTYCGPRGALTILRHSELESRLRTILTPDRLHRRGAERLHRALLTAGLFSVALGLAMLAPSTRKARAAGGTAVEVGVESESSISRPGLPRDPESGQASPGGTPEISQASDETNAPGQSTGAVSQEQAATAPTPVGIEPESLAQPAQARSVFAESATMPQESQSAEQQVESATGVEALIAGLKDHSEGVRAQSAWALGLHGDDRAIEPLISALKDGSPRVRSQAAWALGLKGDDRAVEPLASALKDSESHVRSQSAWALGLKGDKRSVEALVAALTDPESHVRSLAAWALGLKGDRRAVDPLATALRDQEPHVRSQAAWALGLKGDSRAVEPLILALKDESPHVRSQAAWALGLRGDTRAVNGLKDLLNDSANQVRRQAGWALGMLLMRSGGEEGDEHEDEGDDAGGTAEGSLRNQRPHPRPRPNPRAHPTAVAQPSRVN